MKSQIFSPQLSSIFVELSIQEQANVNGAYGRRYNSISPRFNRHYAYTPPQKKYSLAYRQHHYTYYSVANPNYLLG